MEHRRWPSCYTRPRTRTHRSAGQDTSIRPGQNCPELENTAAPSTSRSRARNESHWRPSVGYVPHRPRRSSVRSRPGSPATAGSRDGGRARLNMTHITATRNPHTVTKESSAPFIGAPSPNQSLSTLRCHRLRQFLVCIHPQSS